MNEPKWHGWATIEQVRRMMNDMRLFLDEHGTPCPFIMANGELCGSKQPHKHYEKLVLKDSGQK